MDFHGNSVHQVGFGNPKVTQAIKDQLGEGGAADPENAVEELEEKLKEIFFLF